MSILSTLALVVIPLVRPKKKNTLEAELERQLTEARAERDLWRAECLAVREKLTNATIENIHLTSALKMQPGSEPKAIEWADCTCTPDRAEALKRGE